MNGKEAHHLAQKIKARKRFLEKVVVAAVQMLHQIGEPQSRPVSTSSAKRLQVRGLPGKIKIFGCLNQSSMGGNQVWVEYKGTLVLDVYFQSATFSVDDTEVTQFAPNTAWQQQLMKIAKFSSEIIMKVHAADREKAKNSRDAEQHARRHKDLEKQAVRLGLSL